VIWSAAVYAAYFGVTEEQFAQQLREPLASEIAGKAFVSLARGEVQPMGLRARLGWAYESKRADGGDGVNTFVVYTPRLMAPPRLGQDALHVILHCRRREIQPGGDLLPPSSCSN
jgi:hypothetical protein